MAGPITWRTVMGQSLAEAGRPMEAAQRSISSALTGLGSLVSEQQQLNQNAVDAGREANVQAFLERLQGAQSVDDVAALKSSGELDTLRSALTPKDLVRVRGAEDARATALMQQAAAQRTFASQEAAAKAAPIKDQVLTLFQSGDPANRAKAQELIAANPQFQWADTIKTMADFDAQKQQRDFAAQMNPLRLQEAQSNIAAAAANREASVEQRNAAKLAQEAAMAAAKLEQERQYLKETGNEYADGLLTPDRAPELLEFMTKNGIGDDVGERQAVIKRFLEMNGKVEIDRIKEVVGKDGKVKYEKVKDSVPISFARAREAIAGSKDQMVNLWNQGYANTAESNLKASLKATMPMQTVDGRAYTQNKAAFDYDQYMENRNGAVKAAPVVGKPKTK